MASFNECYPVASRLSKELTKVCSIHMMGEKSSDCIIAMALMVSGLLHVYAKSPDEIPLMHKRFMEVVELFEEMSKERRT